MSWCSMSGRKSGGKKPLKVRAQWLRNQCIEPNWFEMTSFSCFLLFFGNPALIKKAWTWLNLLLFHRTFLLFYSSKLLKTAIGPILLSIFVNFLDFYAYRRKFHRLKLRTSQNILIICIVFSILFHRWSKTYRVFMSLFMFGSVWWVGKLFGAVELLGVLAVERLVARVRPHVNLSVFRPGERSVAIFVL